MVTAAIVVLVVDGVMDHVVVIKLAACLYDFVVGDYHCVCRFACEFASPVL